MYIEEIADEIISNLENKIKELEEENFLIKKAFKLYFFEKECAGVPDEIAEERFEDFFHEKFIEESKKEK